MGVWVGDCCVGVCGERGGELSVGGGGRRRRGE